MGILKPTFLEIKILKIWLLFSNVMFVYYYLISFNIPTIGYTAIDRIYTAVIQYYGLAVSSNISRSDPIYSVAVSLKQDITVSSYLASKNWKVRCNFCFIFKSREMILDSLYFYPQVNLQFKEKTNFLCFFLWPTGQYFPDKF